jgi:hypothetical protein
MVYNPRPASGLKRRFHGCHAASPYGKDRAQPRVFWFLACYATSAIFHGPRDRAADIPGPTTWEHNNNTNQKLRPRPTTKPKETVIPWTHQRTDLGGSRTSLALAKNRVVRDGPSGGCEWLRSIEKNNHGIHGIRKSRASHYLTQVATYSGASPPNPHQGFALDPPKGQWPSGLPFPNGPLFTKGGAYTNDRR